MSEQATTQDPGDGGKKGPIDLFLSLFADVRPGEGLTSLILMANVLLLLVAYYVLKTVREPLILASGGAQLKAYATAAQAVLLIGFVPAYSALTKRMKRMQLITATLVFYAGVFVLFWVLAKIGVPYLGFAFFLVLGIFSLSAIAQFWSLANDLYTKEQGKRLFAILGIGASLGAVVGSYVASKLVEPLGPFPMMIVASVILAICLALSWTANARESNRAKTHADGGARDDETIGGKNGFALILEDRYLLLVALVILLLNLVNTTGELIMSERVTQEAAATVPDFASLPKDAQKEIVGKFAGKWYGEFFTWVNAIGAVAQLFLVSRIFKYLGIRAALFSLPLIGLFTYGTFAFIGTFALVRAGKIAENATDYSLYNTTKQALWLPTTREQKYNAKMAIDTFIVRVGDLVSGLFVGWGLKNGMAVEKIAMVNLGIILVWLVVVVLVGRENSKRMADDDAPVPSKS